MSFVPSDMESVIARVVVSLGTVADWIEQRDFAEAVELVHFIIDDIEQIAAREGAALDKAA